MRIFTCVILAFFLFGAPLFSHANNCGSATFMNTGNTYTLTFDNSVDYSPPGQRPCSNTAPSGDAWFEWIPGGTNTTNYNVSFEVTVNFTGRINMALIYSESFEAGNPCQWGTNTEGYTYYNTDCNRLMYGSTYTFSFENQGLDGSGHFFLLVERVGGNGGTVSVRPVVTSTCTAPTNDRCATPTVLGLSNGIDPNSTNANPNTTLASWMVSANASTHCATKQRMDDGCQAGGADPTEDHYGDRFIGACFWGGNIGDNGSWPITLNQCDVFLENTVYYRFRVPVTSNDWRIHFGSTTRCAQEPSNMVAMLLENVDCNNADNTDRLECAKFNVNGGIPSADRTFGPRFLAANTDYYLVFDGTRGSQCEMNILITRSGLNPVLPVSLQAFEGLSQGKETHLSWETSAETNHDYFEVETRLEGAEFESLGKVTGQGAPAEGQVNTYTFVDRFAPVGRSFYRLKMVDIDGQFVYSKTLEVIRQSEALEIDAIYPVPMRDQVAVRLGIAESGTVELMLTDFSGKTLRNMNFEGKTGSHEAVLDVADLPAGFYLLRVRQGFHSHVRKLIKQ